MWLARISLTLSLHVSLSFIAFGRSSGLHPVSSHSCCMNVRAGRPAFDWLYAGVHRSTSLTISSLLLQQCPACVCVWKNRVVQTLYVLSLFIYFLYYFLHFIKNPSLFLQHLSPFQVLMMVYQYRNLIASTFQISKFITFG